MRSSTHAALAVLAGLSVACFGRPTYECDDFTQCRVGDVMGVCEPDGLCSYHDEACASGQRYSPYAGSKAEECVPVDGSTDEPTTSTTASATSVTSATSSSTNVATEATSDDATTTGCATDCPGDEIWSTVRPELGAGQANGVAVIASGIAIAGEATIEDRVALVVATFANDGEFVSPFEWPSPSGGPDRGFGLASLGGDDVVVAGVETTASTGERGLLFRLDDASAVAWTRHYDTAAADALRGAAVSDRIVAVGTSGSRALALAWDDEGTEVYSRVFGPSGDALAVALHAVALTEGGAAVLGGAIQTASMQSDLWVRTVGPDGGVVLDVPNVDATVAVDVAFGVAPLPDGGAMVCGVVGGKAWIARLEPAGGFAFQRAAEEQGSSARAIAIADDHAIVVGSIDDEGRDAWIAAFALENGESRWDAPIGGDFDDEALAVALGDDDIAYVAGYRSDASGPAIWLGAYRR